jgi:hypothetical protein
MYAFLLSKVFGEDRYEFFTYNGKQPVMVEFRGKPIPIKKGTRFGVRPSSNKKSIRLIFPNDKTRVITIDLATANKLANNLVKEH